MEINAQEMEINYMKNDLSKEEAELRKKKSMEQIVFQRYRNLQVVFFYMKYLPHFLYYYGLDQL